MADVKGMTTCKVCGRGFPLIFEEHYAAVDSDEVGLGVALSRKKEPGVYDAFDCPHCGCQNIMQDRKRNYCPCDYGICDECEGEEEEDNE